MTVLQDSTSGVLKISGTLDIDAANSLRQNLLDSLIHRPVVEADLSAVEACDAAALQVLLAAQRNQALRILAASPALTATAAALGFSLSEEHPHAS